MSYPLPQTSLKWHHVHRTHLQILLRKKRTPLKSSFPFRFRIQWVILFHELLWNGIMYTVTHLQTLFFFCRYPFEDWESKFFENRNPFSENFDSFEEYSQRISSIFFPSIPGKKCCSSPTSDKRISLNSTLREKNSPLNSILPFMSRTQSVMYELSYA